MTVVLPFHDTHNDVALLQRWILHWLFRDVATNVLFVTAQRVLDGCVLGAHKLVGTNVTVCLCDVTRLFVVEKGVDFFADETVRLRHLTPRVRVESDSSRSTFHQHLASMSVGIVCTTHAWIASFPRFDVRLKVHPPVSSSVPRRHTASCSLHLVCLDVLVVVRSRRIRKMRRMVAVVLPSSRGMITTVVAFGKVACFCCHLRCGSHGRAPRHCASDAVLCVKVVNGRRSLPFLLLVWVPCAVACAQHPVCAFRQTVFPAWRQTVSVPGAQDGP